MALTPQKRFTWKDVVMLLAACAASFAFIKTTLVQNDQVRTAKEVAHFNADAICQQAQVLISLSLQNAKTDAQIDRTLRLSKLYLKPVNDARIQLGLPPCLPQPKEKK